MLAECEQLEDAAAPSGVHFSCLGFFWTALLLLLLGCCLGALTLASCVAFCAGWLQAPPPGGPSIQLAGYAKRG